MKRRWTVQAETSSAPLKGNRFQAATLHFGAGRVVTPEPIDAIRQVTAAPDTETGGGTRAHRGTREEDCQRITTSVWMPKTLEICNVINISKEVFQTSLDRQATRQCGEGHHAAGQHCANTGGVEASWAWEKAFVVAISIRSYISSKCLVKKAIQERGTPGPTAPPRHCVLKIG